MSSQAVKKRRVSDGGKSVPQRTHEEVEQQLQDLMGTVKEQVPELSFLELRCIHDEEDYRKDPPNYMRINVGKIVECNTLGGVTWRKERTKDDFLHECGHALFRRDGLRSGLVTCGSPQEQDSEMAILLRRSEYMFHELGAEVFAHIRFSESLNFGEARGKDTVHHFYCAAIRALWDLYEGLRTGLEKQVVEQSLGWARLAYKHYFAAPCRPDRIDLEAEILEFITGKNMVFPEDEILPLWEGG